MDNIFFLKESAHVTAYQSSKNLLLSLSVRYAERLNPLECAYFDCLQAAVILIKGLLSKKYAKIIFRKILL